MTGHVKYMAFGFFVCVHAVFGIWMGCLDMWMGHYVYGWGTGYVNGVISKLLQVVSSENEGS